MALLLAMYQKMKLVREKNQLVLADARTSSKKSRIQKTIERVQKMYTSRLASVDNKAKMAQSLFNCQYTQMKQQFNAGYGLSGLGMTGMPGMANSYSGMSGFGGMSIFMMQQMNSFANAGWQDKDRSISGDDAAALWSAYQSGKLKQNYDENNKLVEGAEWIIKDTNTTFSQEQVDCMNAAYQDAQMAQAQSLNYLEQMNQMNQMQIQSMVEMEKAQIEAEQDAALEPLNYEDTMLDLEKTQIETRLEQVRAELESYTQLVKEEAKDSAPTFGLG